MTSSPGEVVARVALSERHALRPNWEPAMLPTPAPSRALARPRNLRAHAVRGLPRLGGVARALLVLMTLGALVASAEAAFALGSLPGGRATYGPAIGADALNNSIVGGRDHQDVAFRFRATTSSRLESIRIYIMTGSGYSAGNGGAMRITVRSNVRRLGHVPSGRVLASRTVQRPSFDAGVEYRFASPPALRKGRIYHVVFENVDGAPTRNWVSVNGLFVFDEERVWQPAFRNLDWARLVRSGNGRWSDDAGGGITTPIMGLKYANGHRSGVGYMEVWGHNTVRIGGALRARQTFRVSGRSRLVTAVAVRLKRLSGEGPLEVRLSHGDRVIASGRIPAARIAHGTLRHRGGARWVKLDFPGRARLHHGESYRLLLSSPSGTQYAVVGVRQGSSYGYHHSSFFSDGRAEYDPGSGWRPFIGWGRPSVEADLQFYFR